MFQKSFIKQLLQVKSFFSSFIIFSFILLIGFTTGCDDSTSPETEYTGKIVGWVQPIDQWLRPMEKSGVTVKLQGTPYSDTTNAEGYYMLEKVPPGTYTITYSREGFGTNKLPFFDFAADGKQVVENKFKLPGQNKYITFVGKTPSYTVRVDSIYPPQFGLVRLDILFSTTVPKEGAAMIAILQSDTPDISADPSGYTKWAIFGAPPGYNGLAASVSVPSNQSVYYRIYPTAGYTTFADPEAKSTNLAWGSLGQPSEVIEVTPPENSTSADPPSKLKGKFVFLGKDGEAIKKITIPKHASHEETKQLFQEARQYILKYRRMWINE